MMMQETHVTTDMEAANLNAEWKRLWGIADPELQSKFWGLAHAKAGGVAIVANPATMATRAHPHRKDAWSERHVAIKVGSVIYATVYAPNDRTEGEHFFEKVARIHAQRQTSSYWVAILTVSKIRDEISRATRPSPRAPRAQH